MAPSNRRRIDRKNRSRRQPERRSLGGVTRQCLELARKLRRGEVLEKTLRAVTRTAELLTASDQATLRLLDDSGKRLLTSARAGPSVHRRGNTPFRIGEGFIGWVVVHQQAELINAVRSDPRFVQRSGQLWTPTGILAVPLLADGGCIGVLSAARRDGRRYRPRDLELLELVAQLSVPYLEIARLKRLNESDPLTLLHNRRHLQERLPDEILRARQQKSPLAVAMMDLDRFKRVNDSHGHDVGDQVLIELADRLRRLSRATDVMARWGGEEFFAIFPHTTREQARAIGERLRAAVAGAPFATSAGPIGMTISLGLAMLGAGDDAASIERRADQALYRAKRGGRDRVLLAGCEQTRAGRRD